MAVTEVVTHDEIERVVNSLKFSVQGYVADAANAVLARIEPRLDRMENRMDRIESALAEFVQRFEAKLDTAIDFIQRSESAES